MVITDAYTSYSALNRKRLRKNIKLNDYKDLARIIINFLRHDVSNYNKLINMRDWTKEEKDYIRWKVMQKTKEYYPELLEFIN